MFGFAFIMLYCNIGFCLLHLFGYLKKKKRPGYATNIDYDVGPDKRKNLCKIVTIFLSCIWWSCSKEPFH